MRKSLTIFVTALLLGQNPVLAETNAVAGL